MLVGGKAGGECCAHPWASRRARKVNAWASARASELPWLLERREKIEDGKRKWEERVQGGVLAECAAKRVYVYQALRGRQRQVRGLSVAGKGGQRATGGGLGSRV
jgi:hypothetical protein